MQNTEYMNVKASGTYSYHCVLRNEIFMFVYGGKESNKGTRKDGKRRGLEGKKVMQK